MTAPPPATRILAAFAAGPLSAGNPAERATEVVGASLGGSLLGTTSPEAMRALVVFSEFGSTPQATILGPGRRAGVAWAARANALAASWVGMGDLQPVLGLRFGPSVVPAALAVAELNQLTVQRLREAVAVGLEVACRLASALGYAHAGRGWEPSCTCGAVGAAAAAGRLADLDQESMTAAIALAATQASGLAAAGREATSLLHARAAAVGVESAFLARSGFTAARAAIEGRRGMNALMAGEGRFDLLADGLGELWQMDSLIFNPHDCEARCHPAIELARRLPRAGQEIQEVVLEAPAVFLTHLDRPRPESMEEARESLQHQMALALLGSGGASAGDALASIRGRVRLVASPRGEGPVRLTVIQRGGRRWSLSAPELQLTSAGTWQGMPARLEAALPPTQFGTWHRIWERLRGPGGLSVASVIAS